MIAYLRGNVIERTAESVVLDVGGVGYEIFCSSSALALLTAKTVNVGVYTYLQVKEDAMTLFGFSSPAEKKTFCDLLSVSGVGPKMAIGVLLYMTAEEVASAILSKDAKRLSKVKGLGKKTAEKIILELHGKASAEELLGEDKAPMPKKQPVPIEDEEAVQALLSLGFSRAECLSAVERAKNAGASGVEDILRVALSGM